MAEDGESAAGDDASAVSPARSNVRSSRRNSDSDESPAAASYRLLFQKHPTPMWVYDPDTMAFLDVNEAAVANYGWTREEFLRLTLTDIRPTEERLRMQESVHRARRENWLNAGVWHHRTRNGTEINVRITSNNVPFAGRRARLVMAEDVTEWIRAQEERQAAEDALRSALLHERTMLREVLYSVTEGKLRLCEFPEELPPPLPPPPLRPERFPVVALVGAEALADVRRQVRKAGEACEFPPERWYDLMTASSECAMNALQHGGGEASVHVGCSPEQGVLQIRVADKGNGIRIEELPRATLLRGHSGAGTLGHGFHLILATCDRLWLLTGPEGTTVVLEQERTAPEPPWLASNN